jgi:hypothetical protein
MSWTIVNVTLGDQGAIDGKNGIANQLIQQIVADGFEPFAT